jgi:hypothetical protein
MKYKNAIQLHAGDKVTVTKTLQVMTVVKIKFVKEEASTFVNCFVLLEDGHWYGYEKIQLRNQSVVQINIEMPTDCASCWIRHNMGCRIANESGWLNNARDERCPLQPSSQPIRCEKCIYGDDFDCPAPLPKGYLCQKGHGSHTGDWFCADGKLEET